MSERTHCRRIGLLIAWAVLVQAWVVARNPVPAQDAIGFIQFARQLDHHSLIETLRSNTQHPLYPMLVSLQHSLVGRLFGSEGMAWIRSAQVVAALASVLLVVPMYMAGVRLANPHLATAAVGVFSVLPFASRMGADALGDSTYLLFMLTGLWGCIEFLASRRMAWLFMAGLAVGIGFLSRPEAMLLPAAFVVTLLILQFRRDWRMPWRRLIAAAVCGLGGLLCIAAPYTVAIGKLTPKGSLNFLPGGKSLFAWFDADLGRPATRTFSDGQSVPMPSTRTLLPPPSHSELDFALNHRPDGKRLVGYLAACAELVRELVEGMHYVLGFLVLIGVLFVQREPANLLCSSLAAIFLVVLVQFASKSGYVASRHVLTLVCLSCYVAARGGWVLAGWLAWSWNRRRRANPLRSVLLPCGFETQRRRIAVGLFALAALLCLPRTLGLLHHSRESHIAAGRWLAENAAAGSIVLDSRGWASLYSGLPAYDYNGARLAFENPNLAYVVVESEELADDRPRGETLRHLLGIAGQIVADFPAAGGSNESIKVYAWHPDRLEPNQAGLGLRAN